MLVQVINLEDAKRLGLKKYFTGQQCKRGHISERYTNKRSCVMCVREDSLRRSRTEKVKQQNKQYKKTDEYKKSTKEYKQRDYVKIAAREYAKKAWRENQSYRDSVRLSAKRNKEKRREYSREYYHNNKEYFQEKLRTFSKCNPGYFNSKNSFRRSSRKLRTPKWISEWDSFVISEAHKLATERTIKTGIKWHVDHLVPLLCKHASGLHCAENIQVIPAYINQSKGNKMLFIEPFSWLEITQ